MRSPGKASGCAFVAILFLTAQMPPGFARWESEFAAPDNTGIYNVILRANYRGLVGSYPMTLRLVDFVSNSPELKISPVKSLVSEPPIPLKYKVTVDGEPVSDLVRSDVTISFFYGGSELDFTADSLSGGGGVFSTMADVPFAGEYLARAYVETEVDERVYSGSFASPFFSAYPSPELKLGSVLFGRIFTPRETFDVYANLTFRGMDLFGMNILKIMLYEDRYSMVWDDSINSYTATIPAPEKEGIYDLVVYAAEQSLSQRQYIFVVDTTLQKAPSCPAPDSQCNSMVEARRCVYEYKSGQSPLNENQVIDCILSAGVPPVIPLLCTRASRGDFDGDSQIDEADIFIMENQILPQPSKAEYIACADFDFNGVVDEMDVECMRKVIDGEYEGGVGGGFCTTYTMDSILKGDFVGDLEINSEDESKMKEIVEMSMNGAPVPQDLLGFADFNQDGTLDDTDLSCLRSFMGLSYSGEAEQPTRPSTGSECVAIYNMDECMGIRGDINADEMISEVDEILMLLIWIDFIPRSSVKMSCADVNKNSNIDEGDLWCITSYLSGDKEAYWENCLQCATANTGYFHEQEICGDNRDNDCDGLVDKTSEDPAEDRCQCNSKTPCNQKWDEDGGLSPGIEDDKYLVCRKITSKDGEEEGWLTVPEPQCSPENECKEFTCKGTTIKCAYDGENWNWYDPGDLPHEDKFTLCGDGYDNNCIATDAKCFDPTPYIQMGTQMMSSLLSSVGGMCGMIPGPAGMALSGIVSALGPLMSQGGNMMSMLYKDLYSPEAQGPQ
ncbi:MAG: hypothetical protein JXB14_04125 [Candidatus Altiarchaeota archaeon]|nr:hypothetical protein [Candidatus Altiarchaeota archaeon]